MPPIRAGSIYVPQAVASEFQLDFRSGRSRPFGEGDDLRILFECRQLIPRSLRSL